MSEDMPPPFPGLWSDAEELHATLREAAYRLPAKALTDFAATVAEAAARGDEHEVTRLALGMLAELRLSKNEDYRRGVKEVLRDDVQPVALDHRAYVSSLRAG